MPMSSKARENAEAFKNLMEEKIRALIAEFAEGEISREQFHTLYERYSSRLSIANEALITGTPEAVEIAQVGPPTIAVRGALMGRTTGLLIYHHLNRTFIEALGEFNVSRTKLEPTLNEFSMMMEINKMVERRLTQQDGHNWLLYNPGRYTTVVVAFRNEPSPVQMREIARLHHDFEVANATPLQSKNVDSSKLAQPFIVFIKEKFGSK